MGNNNGRGYIYLSGGNLNTANTRGGGISYPGDLSPTFATGEEADNINFYRKMQVSMKFCSTIHMMRTK